MNSIETDNVAEALTVGECIARRVMPQVDDEHLPELLEFLGTLGISYVSRHIDPRQLKGQQKIVTEKVKGIIRTNREMLQKKPSLVSHDRLIVDGNHRVGALRILKEPAPIYLFSEVFSVLLPAVFKFPRTYAYGDGKFHPVRN